MVEYHFDEEMFKNNFKAKEPGVRPADSYRLNNSQNDCFKLLPYKGTPIQSSPIVLDFSEIVSPFFRKTLGVATESLSFDELCDRVLTKIEIDEPNDVEAFQDVLKELFFSGDSFRANNIGLYPYQTYVENKSSENIADYLFCVFGMNEEDKTNITNAEKNYPFNVLEELVVESIVREDTNPEPDYNRYFQIKHCIQDRFREDFSFMLSSGMTSIEDFSNVLSFYYFYYVSQTAHTLDKFGNGDRDNLEKLYFALDWEKVSKNRLCCLEGWDWISNNISRLFSHAITLEILNQNNGPMVDYIELNRLADEDPEIDAKIAMEIKTAERIYTSYVGDYQKFDEIKEEKCKNETDSAMRHLFMCVQAQFDNTTRQRVCKNYSARFTEFCKYRFIKNRKKSGLVLNLTERDVIFLTKLALKNEEKIRLNDLYSEYEKRGVYLDSTSRALLQEYFTKLNLIDNKSDSGDAQYVKRIL